MRKGPAIDFGCVWTQRRVCGIELTRLSTYREIKLLVPYVRLRWPPSLEGRLPPAGCGDRNSQAGAEVPYLPGGIIDVHSSTQEDRHPGAAAAGT